MNRGVEKMENNYPEGYWQTLPKMLKNSAERFPELPAQYYKDESGTFIPRTYEQTFQTALDFAAGLAEIGVVRQDKIALISENRAEWQVADMGLLSIGAIDCPRGSDATEGDLTYILSFAEVKVAILENERQIEKVLNNIGQIPSLKTVIAIEKAGDKTKESVRNAGLGFFDFSEILENGKKWRKSNPGYVEGELEKGQWDDLASIIFTSGTTGNPKGVMLTHGNFLAQLDDLDERINMKPGSRCLVILPVWHAFERECEYVILSQGGSLNYSKPIGSILLADIEKVNPVLIPAVPRVWEGIYEAVQKKMRKAGGITLFMFRLFFGISSIWNSMYRLMFNRRPIYRPFNPVLSWLAGIIPFIFFTPGKLLGDLLVFRKIRKLLGKNWRSGISGGGAYPVYIDKFFWACGVKIVQGYGLTETAPVISVCPISRNALANVGVPIRHIEAAIRDENGNDCKPGQMGALYIRGDTVMKGYYKRDDKTAEVIDRDGWFDTGDLCVFTYRGEIQIMGRKKDTIVLMGGENIEPLPIETKINQNRFVSVTVVVGQDQRNLAALILPNREEVEGYAAENKIQYKDYDELLSKPEVRKMFATIISDAINPKNGFKSYERVNDFDFITKEFEIGVELSAKQEMRRNVICEMYKAKIKKLFQH